MIDEPTDPRARVERELDRVLARLGALGPPRITREGPDGVTGISRVRAALDAVAAAAAAAEHVPLHAVPELAAHAVGDQLVVLVRDLLGAALDDAALTATGDLLVELRRRL